MAALRRMGGICPADHGKAVLPWIEDHQQKGDKTVVQERVGELTVEPQHGFLGRRARGDAKPHLAAQAGHQKSGGNTLARYVSHGNCQATVVERNVSEVVSPHVVSRLIVFKEPIARQFGCRLRQKVELHFASRGKLAFATV